jgi:hypothetical protein
MPPVAATLPRGQRGKRGHVDLAHLASFGDGLPIATDEKHRLGVGISVKALTDRGDLSLLLGKHYIRGAHLTV